MKLKLKIFFLALTNQLFKNSDALCPSFLELKTDAVKNVAWQKAIRRALHQYPELSHFETKTSQSIQNELLNIGVKFSTGWSKKTLKNGTIIGGTGIVATIGTGKSPCVAFRADIDALPITELSNVSFASVYSGRMHACGHDAHTTMAIGAARLLKQHEKHLKGTVKLIFQPAEEFGGGGKCMVEEGVLTAYPPVESIFGFHVNPMAPTGELWSRSGVVMAACTSFDIKIIGVGGHSAAPYLATDPVTIAAIIIQSINSAIARGIAVSDYTHAGVVSITSVQTPESYNVIPPYAKLQGTIRALNDAKLMSLKNTILQIVTLTAQAFKAHGIVEFVADPYPATVNDAALFEWSRAILNTGDVEQGNIVTIEPFMGSEDFSFYGKLIPAVFLFIGTGSAHTKDIHHPPSNISLHSPHFVLDEDVLPQGSAISTYLLMSRLEKLSEKIKQSSTNDEL